MKREGRQHGTVRTFRIVSSAMCRRPTNRPVNRLDSPPTSGLFTKVPSNPTNHSKFTGKCGKPRCGECHTSPVSKAAGKAKGVQKLRAADYVFSDYRVMDPRVVDNRYGFNFPGLSVRGMLDNLDRAYVNDDDDDDDIDEDNDDHDGGDDYWEIQPYVG